MLTFLLGRYGTGKTAYIVDKIASDVAQGRQSFWLVPEQKAMSCERKIATSLPSNAQLHTEVLNFTRLCDKVFRLSGGLKYNYLTRGGKSLVMYRTICEVRENLIEYKVARGRERGLVELFLDTIGELKSYCITPNTLQVALEQMNEGRLKNKVADLYSVYSVYETMLSEKFDDPYDDIIILSKKLDTCRVFEGANVYISSFDGFTGAQLLVLEKIFAQANEVFVSLDVDTTRLGKIQYSKLSKTYKSLQKIARDCNLKTECVSFDEDLLHKNECLEYLVDHIWDFGAKPYTTPCEEENGSCGDAPNGITLMRPGDEFEECELVAGKIKELVMNGAKYGEIAVITRNADAYKGIIDYCFDKYEIPYYMSTSTDITTKPLIKMIYSAISSSVDFNVRDITAFIRSGYTDISYEDADELESYIYRWGIYGKRFENDDFWSANPDGYVTNPTEEQISRLSRINDTRAQILGALMPLGEVFRSKKGADVICRAIYDLLVRLGVREKILKEIEESSREEKKELAQLYSATMKSLGTLADILGDAYMDKDGFLSSFSYVLSEVKVGTIPTGEDNVTIGEAGTLRAERIKHAFVLGVCEGAFPQSVVDKSFFSDSDKLELETHNIILSSLSEEKADDELLIFKNSIAIPSHTLFVSSPRADIRGGRKEPSIAYRRIKELFPSIGNDDEVPVSIMDKIYSPKIAMEYIYGDSDEAQAIREVLGKNGTESVDFSNEGTQISQNGTLDLFGERIYLSQSQIEKFVSCHFNYYCTYELGIKESEKICFGAREVGVLAHTVFECFLKKVSEGKLSLEAITDEQIEAEIEEITQSYIKELYPLGEPTSKLKHLFRRLRRNILIYLKETVRELLHSKFKPTLFEVKFSKSNGIVPLEIDLEGGRKITLTGVADRVDVYEHEDTLYVRVVDYKTGEKKFSFGDFANGLELQLFIYLYTLCSIDDAEMKKKLWGKDTQVEPAGVMYYAMNLGKGKVDKEIDPCSDEGAEAEKSAIKDLVKRSGVFLDDESVLLAQDDSKEFLPSKTYNKAYYRTKEGFEALRGELEATIKRVGQALTNGDASAKPLHSGDGSECKFCPYRAICRRREV